MHCCYANEGNLGLPPHSCSQVTPLNTEMSSTVFLPLSVLSCFHVDLSIWSNLTMYGSLVWGLEGKGARESRFLSSWVACYLKKILACYLKT